MSAARAEMETNYFGTLSMARAFAPVLAAAGGGALVNVLSVVSWYAPPFNASYCASKSAEWALTNALRVELHGQGTLVVGVHAGFIDTDMAAAVEDAKISPSDVVAQTLDAVEKGQPEVLTDDWTRHVKDSVATDQQSLYPDIQRSWDAGESPWKTR
jgi:NAD(P)-dependent dehydrogenase (short-subunit alcohol dehydrogenase family)